MLALLICLAVLLLALGWYMWSSTPAYFLSISLVAICLAAGGFTFACLAIKCDKCGLKWFWRAVSTQHSREWGLWLANLTECPGCGDIEQSTGE